MSPATSHITSPEKKMIITHVLLEDGTDGSLDGDCEEGDVVTVLVHDKDGLSEEVTGKVIAILDTTITPNNAKNH